MGKLDTVTVNGPEGDVVDWDAVDWRAVEDDVRRLRHRIFTATQAGDLKKVRNLQKLMLRSRANALLSVRRVTEVNAGRKTAGVDGRVVLEAWEKAEMATWLQRGAPGWRPQPVKRVFIPKANGKRRGLGIPVIADRALQALTVGALEPEWEARFESRSYGFRPGRGCQDAMQAIFVTARGASCRRQWALDADLAAAFDRIDHSHLLDQLGTFPARGMIAAWLTAGVMDQGRFAPTERGSPQGGVISPVLMNVALHGMEEAAGVRYIRTGSNAGTARPGSPVLIRYADDLLALCHSRAQAEQVKARLAAWLAPRGSGLQRGQDPHRAPRRWGGLPGIQRPPLPRQAADQTEQGGRETDPGTADRRDESAARAQRADGAHPAQPDHPGLVGLLPACGVRPGVQRVGLPRVEAHLQVGEVHPSAQVETLDHLPVLRRVQLRPGAIGGCSATATAAPTCSSSPGRRSPGTRWSRAGRPRTTRPWPTTGRPGADAGDPRWTGPGCGFSTNNVALPALRRPAAPRRYRAATPRRLGTVDHSDPQGDPPPRARPRRGARDTGQRIVFRLIHTHCRHRPPRRHRQWTSTSAP